MKFSFSIISIFAVLLSACNKEEKIEEVKLDETPYTLKSGYFPAPTLPIDNVLTNQIVKLGRMLFYEKMLSRDQSMSCASCHVQNDGFSDTTRFSVGVEKLPGKRQAMAIFNMAWHSNEFFWDGRAHLLRDQSLKPIQDPLEMNETLDNVIAKLNSSGEYRNQFIRSYGTEDITPEKMSLAMEQFMLSIVSNDSKYDKFKRGETTLSASEERGLALFETEFNPYFPEYSGADCAHCHSGFNFENNKYMNNGLDGDAEITDIGREMVTGLESERAKFKVPSLRNVAVTAPYMHDGRFKTLNDVLDHYNEHLKMSNSIDPALIQVVEKGGLKLTEEDKADIINFLNTLTDETYLNNEEYSSPF